MRITALGGISAVVAGAGIGAVMWLRRRFVVVTVRGVSMQPTFRPGDRVLVRRAPLSAIRPGAVVVIEQPMGGASSWERGGGRGLDRHWMIKRAVAVAGSPVPHGLAEALGVTPGALVPSGRLAVLGDNPDHSYDSRWCGYITEAQVLGLAVRAVGDHVPSRNQTADRAAR